MNKKSLGLMFLILALAVAGGCISKGGTCGPTEPGCGGGGSTAQIQQVDTDVPDGSVVDKGGHFMVTFWFTSDLPDSEYINIRTAVSNEQDILTEGFGGTATKTVGSWKKSNPNRLSVISFVRVDTTFNYVHVIAIRGFGPDPSQTKPPIPISALINVLAHEVLARKITFLNQWTMN